MAADAVMIAAQESNPFRWGVFITFIVVFALIARRDLVLPGVCTTPMVIFEPMVVILTRLSKSSQSANVKSVMVRGADNYGPREEGRGDPQGER
jgi:hypothetical protein